ncbi:MAG: transporter substrate-binding domain-containing protein [Gammaproteobacteria bacterium]|nr:transporter substrate-binding domain-containing protein [Gammaproteobacteria bacterium]
MKQNVITIIIAAIVALAVTFLRPATTDSVVEESKETVAQRVERTGVLQCGYNTEPPMLSVEPNTGKVKGATVDVIEHMADLIGWKVDWTEQVGWSEMTAGLNADRFDLACNGKWIFASQTRGAQFTMPIYFTATYAYGRFDENRFSDDLSELNDSQHAIATIDGEFNYYVAQTRFPKARRVELPATIDKAVAIENLITNKADAMFLAAFEADVYMTQNPGKLKKLSSQPISVFDTAFMFKAGESEFAAMLDGALRQLRGDGFIDDTLDKYDIDASATLRVSTPYKMPE